MKKHAESESIKKNKEDANVILNEHSKNSKLI